MFITHIINTITSQIHVYHIWAQNLVTYKDPELKHNCYLSTNKPKKKEKKKKRRVIGKKITEV